MMEASVIIPTYNRAGKLRRCLQALAGQTHPAADFEVLVVVDGSTDDTLEMLAALQTPFRLRVIPQSNAGQCAALNRGAAEAHGRICIFLDDDITVTPRFLEEHLRPHRSRDRVVGVGQIKLILPPEADWFVRGFAQYWEMHYAELNRGKRPPDWDDCYGGNMSVSREAFLAVGGNAADLKRAYDVELAYRLKQYGCSFEYLTDALGEQHESKGFRELSADAELSGEACVELARRHPPTQPKLFSHLQENRLSWKLVWRLLQAANPSARRMEQLQRFAGKRAGSFKWFPLFYNYYFWRGVQRAGLDASRLI